MVVFSCILAGWGYVMLMKKSFAICIFVFSIQGEKFRLVFLFECSKLLNILLDVESKSVPKSYLPKESYTEVFSHSYKIDFDGP